MRKIIFVFVLMQSLVLTSVGQTISTNAEIYNFDIGDIFHYSHSMSAPNGGDLTEINNTIIGKYYSPNNDTLFYVRDIISRSSSSANPTPVYEYFTDTMYYANLDSFVNHGIIDSVYTDVTKYNGRKINRDTSSLSDLYVNSLGKVYDMIYYSVANSIEDLYQLVYYKKGNEVWGTPIPLGTKSRNIYLFNINIYPNPANNILHLSFEKKLNEDILLSIYNSLGKLVKQQQLAAYSNDYKMNIGELSKGIYFIKFTSNKQPVYSSKFIKK